MTLSKQIDYGSAHPPIDCIGLGEGEQEDSRQA